MNYYKFFIILFIITSFITRTYGSGVGVLGRLTVADVFGLFALIFFFLFGRNRINLSGTAKTYLLFIFLLAPGIIVGFAPSKTILELTIYFFLALIYISIISYFLSKERFFLLLKVFVLAGLIASLIGIWDLSSFFLPIPRIFPMRTTGEAISGFRNAGQAGAYFLVMLTFLISLKQSRLSKKFSYKENWLLNVTILFSVIFIITTGKIAAYIGLGSGLFLSVFINKKIRLLVPLGFLTIILISIIPMLPTIVPSLYKRLNYKVQTRIVENLRSNESLGETNDESFILENIRDALSAFKAYPISGTGIGGFNTFTGKRHEVHSTYFKMIGEGGLLGVIGYILFISTFFIIFIRVRSNYFDHENPYSHFLIQMFPLFLGCIISWSYTYHIRKREFWILAGIITISYYLAKQFEVEQSRQELER